MVGFALHQDVRGLEVAVRQAGLMHRGDPFCELLYEAGG
jgi:hypothetical protein